MKARIVMVEAEGSSAAVSAAAKAVADLILPRNAMTPVVVKIVGAANGRTTPHDGRWLVEWSPHTEAGTLALTSSRSRTRARCFGGPGQVWREMRAISSVEPVRPWDGEPNRPLSALTLQIEPLLDDGDAGLIVPSVAGQSHE